MKLHNMETIHSTTDGQTFCRRAVPGGWIYFSIVKIPYDKWAGVVWLDRVDGAVFVPDPTADHVVNAGKGAP